MTLTKPKKKPSPKKTSYLFTRVDRVLHERAVAAAEAKHMSVSHWLRELVRENTAGVKADR